MSSSETYFVATTIVTSAPTSLCTRSYRSRTASADVGNDSLASGASMVAPVREEAFAVARGAKVEPVDMFDARRAERALGRRPKVEFAALVHDVVPERLAERSGHLVAHLIAAGADARPDHGDELARADCSHAGSHDARKEAAPAGMEDLDRRPKPVGTRDRDRHAIRGKQQHRAARSVAP